MSRSRRIAKELEDVKSDPHSGIDLAMVTESDMGHLKGTFQGPPDTPYEGGEFVVDIHIPVSSIHTLALLAANSSLFRGIQPTDFRAGQ